MAVIGNIPGSNPHPWHELRVEQFGVFEVKAASRDAAWLKLTYFCLERGLGFNPEEQLPSIQEGTSLCHERAAFNNVSPSTDSVKLAIQLSHSPIDVRQFPEHASFIRAQQQPGRVGRRTLEVIEPPQQLVFEYSYPKSA